MRIVFQPKNTSNLAPPYRTPPRGGGWGPDLSGLRVFGQIISGVSAKSAICSDFGSVLSALSAKSVQKGPKTQYEKGGKHSHHCSVVSAKIAMRSGF